MTDRQKNFVAQKVAGLIMLVIGMLSIFIEWDITVAFVAIPLGCYMMLTHLVMFDLFGYNAHDFAIDYTDYEEEDN